MRFDKSPMEFMIADMKVLLAVVLAAVMAQAALGSGLTQVEINGNSYSNITDVHLGTAGLVIIMFNGGGTAARVETVPAEFLKSWGIGAKAQAAAKVAQADDAEAKLDRAIESGAFRQVDGVVYDTRKTQSGWVTFYNVKVLQVIDEGVLIDTTPNAVYTDHVPILVRHLSNVSDTGNISFIALPDGTFSYVNKLGDDRTIRAYDIGTACARSDIPQTVLAGKKAFDSLPLAGAPRIDVLSKLPESDDLVAAGSGFFVSKDGYLITNAHVVRNAHKVKVRIGNDVLPADVVRTDDKADLALLKVSGHFSALCISTNSANLGDQVFTIGFPDIVLQGMEPKYTSGTISSLSGLMDDPTEYQISVPVQPGNSGGPLVDSTGQVAGVIVARLNDIAVLRSQGSLPQNVNYAIKAGVLRTFLSHSPEVKLDGASVAGVSSVAAVQRAVAVVLVY